MRLTKRLYIFLLGLGMTMDVLAQEIPITQDLPDASKFLPGPPVSLTSIQYANDYVQYNWGKTRRTSASYGYDILDYVDNELSEYLRVFARVLNEPLNSTNTPYIYELMDFCMRVGNLTIEDAHEAFNRQRPYAMFGDNTVRKSIEEKYRGISSYPSDQSFFGWLFALVLSEVCSNKNTQILERGNLFGPSMVISGFNWESDCYGGYLLASSLLSRLHTHEVFKTYLQSAQMEYTNKSQTTINSDIPSSYKYLPDPPDMLSYQYIYDLSQYEEGILLRSQAAGEQALEDVEYSAEHFCEIYSEILGVTISPSATPAIFKLMDYVHPYGNSATQETKGGYKRLRPYVQLDGTTSVPEDEEPLRSTGSYPSGHASGSWLMALTLSEVSRTKQDELLARAYQFGQGRVITGFHWQSDVDAGRLVGSVVYAVLHNNSDFKKLMDNAVKEFDSITTGVRSVSNSNYSSPELPAYTIEGVRLQGNPVRHGVYIRGKQKMLQP